MSRFLTALAGVLLMAVSVPAHAAGTTAAASPHDGKGEAIFHATCAACHEHGIGHAPATAILRYMSSGAIYKALTQGAMQVQSAGLSDADKRAVATYLGGNKMAEEAQFSPPQCKGAAARFDYGEPPVFTAWGFDDANRHDIPESVSGISKANVASLKVKWAFGFPAALRARSQPALAGGALYVGSQDGAVYALDRASGCVRWVYHAAAEVRTAIIVAPWRKGDTAAHPLVYFGDLVGNLYAVDAASGKLAWRDHPDPHPSTTLTAAPALVGNKLYLPISSLEEATIDPHYACCTFRGSVVAYDARTGKHLWQTFMTDPPVKQGTNAIGTAKYGPSGVALWNTPAIDLKRHQLIIGTGDNYSQPTSPTSDAVVALDLDTGKIRWIYQAVPNDAWNVACFLRPVGTNCPKDAGPDFDFGASPILATTSDHRDLVLAGQKSGWAYAIDPNNGKLVWKTRVGRGGNNAGIYFGMAVDGDTLFVPVSDTPIKNDVAFDIPPRPGLYALDIRTGAFKWKAPNTEKMCNGRPFCSPGLASAITATDGLVFAGSIDGWLRAYDGETGKVVWRFDTTRSFDTVGGGHASGGSMAGAPAPILYHGSLILPSGYDFAGKMPGNVLLVLHAQ
ncbi:MAG: PQQ-binding-like beta-propeller repeat protein [Alphaproteobacteria bacterium]|nr:PQQ-binding-like beta-propeller repeat protein [Alphaproteobacteria bacterium]